MCDAEWLPREQCLLGPHASRYLAPATSARCCPESNASLVHTQLAISHSPPLHVAAQRAMPPWSTRITLSLTRHLCTLLLREQCLLGPHATCYLALATSARCCPESNASLVHTQLAFSHSPPLHVAAQRAMPPWFTRNLLSRTRHLCTLLPREQCLLGSHASCYLAPATSARCCPEGNVSLVHTHHTISHPPPLHVAAQRAMPPWSTRNLLSRTRHLCTLLPREQCLLGPHASRYLAPATSARCCPESNASLVHTHHAISHPPPLHVAAQRAMPPWSTRNLLSRTRHLCTLLPREQCLLGPHASRYLAPATSARCCPESNASLVHTHHAISHPPPLHVAAQRAMPPWSTRITLSRTRHLCTLLPREQCLLGPHATCYLALATSARCCPESNASLVHTHHAISHPPPLHVAAQRAMPPWSTRITLSRTRHLCTLLLREQCLLGPHATCYLALATSARCCPESNASLVHTQLAFSHSPRLHVAAQRAMPPWFTRIMLSRTRHLCTLLPREQCLLGPHASRYLAPATSARCCSESNASLVHTQLAISHSPPLHVAVQRAMPPWFTRNLLSRTRHLCTLLPREQCLLGSHATCYLALATSARCCPESNASLVHTHHAISHPPPLHVAAQRAMSPWSTRIILSRTRHLCTLLPREQCLLGPHATCYLALATSARCCPESNASLVHTHHAISHPPPLHAAAQRAMPPWSTRITLSRTRHLCTLLPREQCLLEFADSRQSSFSRSCLARHQTCE